MRRVYQIITDRIIENLEEGTVPWRRPWGAADGLPKNLASGREYRGVNVFRKRSVKAILIDLRIPPKTATGSEGKRPRDPRDSGHHRSAATRV